MAAIAAVGAAPAASRLAIAGLLAGGALLACLAAITVGALRPRRLRVPAATGARRPSRDRRRAAVEGPPGDRIAPGDYFSTGRSLYRVEHLAGERVLLEDCRTGNLLAIDRQSCLALTRIKPSARGTG